MIRLGLQSCHSTINMLWYSYCIDKVRRKDGRMKRQIYNKVFSCMIVVVLIFGTINSPAVSAASSVPWSKNEQGQFINGNGAVLEGATMKGIDVSKWNGEINWAKVAASDVDYAIIRCGYGDNYISQDDAYWKKNVEGCEKNNIPYGVYIYSYAETVAQAKSEAAHVLRDRKSVV